MAPMWLFTKYGFFSAVCVRQGDGRHGRPVDPQRIMVRARLREHLEALRQRFPETLGAREIREFPGSDYAYRIFVEKPAWTQVLAELNEEMDYDNFKSAVAHFQGVEGRSYERALHEVWEVMHRLQE
jgi:hypothetical protein